MSRFWPWLGGGALAAMMVVVPTVYYRHTYTHSKRLRTVTEGKVYRSGCMTAPGFREAIRTYKIKTVINLQDEAPDPDLPNHYFTVRTTPESKVCQEMGVRMIFLPVDLVDPHRFPARQPSTIAAFRKIMDDASNYPVLIHCRAGLHRTGCLVALYRQDYEGWTQVDALRELKGNGFGEFFSTTANPYIVQYVVGHPPRTEAPASKEKTIHETSFQPLPTP